MKTNFDKLEEILEEFKQAKEPCLILAKEGEMGISKGYCNQRMEIILLLISFFNDLDEDIRNMYLTILNHFNTATFKEQKNILKVWDEELKELYINQKVLQK